MKEKEIIKNKKLVAEFMGCEVNEWISEYDGRIDISIDSFPNDFFPDHMSEDGAYCSDNIWFDSSWDWLIPVVEKIESLGFRILIVGDEVDIESKFDNKIQKSFGTYCTDGTKLGATYKSVIEFIKWYNEQNKK